MGVAERRAREKDEKRHKILDAAAEIILTEGYDKLTMRKIAEKLEYSPGVIYNYFNDKRQLLFDYCDETFERLEEVFDAMRTEDMGPVEAFRACGEAYIRFALDNPGAYIITFCLPPPSDIPGWFEHETPAGLKSYAVLFDLIVRCQEKGHFRPMDPETASQNVWFSVHGLASMLLLCHGSYGIKWSSRDELIRTHLDMIERGLIVS